MTAFQVVNVLLFIWTLFRPSKSKSVILTDKVVKTSAITAITCQSNVINDHLFFKNITVTMAFDLQDGLTACTCTGMEKKKYGHSHFPCRHIKQMIDLFFLAVTSEGTPQSLRLHGRT